MCCENHSVTGSLDTGALPDTALYAVPVVSALVALACSASGNQNDPLTRWPGCAVSGSATLSVALPAVEVTVAPVDVSYVWSTPGVNAPKLAGALMFSASVAGTVPPTVVVCGVVEPSCSAEAAS